MADTPRDLFKPAGASGLNISYGRVYEGTIKELQGIAWRKNVLEMTSMDPVVGAIGFGIDMVVRQTKHRIVPGGDSPEDTEAAEFIEGALEDMTPSFQPTMAEILTMKDWGWSYLETCFKQRVGPFETDPTKRSRYADGKIGWWKWEIRAQETLDEWDIEDGDVKGLWQMPPPDYKRLYVPRDRALHFRTTIRKASPEGRSILTNAFRPWYFKKNIQNLEGIGVERDLAGLPVIQIPSSFLAEDASTDEKSFRDAMVKLAANLRRNDQEGVVFPLAYDKDGHELYKLTLMSAAGSRQFDTDKIIARYNAEIAMVVLADFIVLGHEKVGSFALASSKTDLFAVAIGAWLSDIAAEINERAIPKLLDLNGYKLEKPPKLQFDDIETVDLAELGPYLSALKNAGVPLNDVSVRKYLLETAGIPVPDDDAALEDPPPGLDASGNPLPIAPGQPGGPPAGPGGFPPTGPGGPGGAAPPRPAGGKILSMTPRQPFGAPGAVPAPRVATENGNGAHPAPDLDEQVAALVEHHLDGLLFGESDGDLSYTEALAAAEAREDDPFDGGDPEDSQGATLSGAPTGGSFKPLEFANPYHDAHGRFASKGGFGGTHGPTGKPIKSSAEAAYLAHIATGKSQGQASGLTGVPLGVGKGLLKKHGGLDAVKKHAAANTPAAGGGGTAPATSPVAGVPLGHAVPGPYKAGDTGPTGVVLGTSGATILNLHAQGKTTPEITSHFPSHMSAANPAVVVNHLATHGMTPHMSPTPPHLAGNTGAPGTSAAKITFPTSPPAFLGLPSTSPAPGTGAPAHLHVAFAPGTTGPSGKPIKNVGESIFLAHVADGKNQSYAAAAAGIGTGVGKGILKKHGGLAAVQAHAATTGTPTGGVTTPPAPAAPKAPGSTAAYQDATTGPYKHGALVNGQVVTGSGAEILNLHAKGHTPDQIAKYLEAQKGYDTQGAKDVVDTHLSKHGMIAPPAPAVLTTPPPATVKTYQVGDTGPTGKKITNATLAVVLSKHNQGDSPEAIAADLGLGSSKVVANYISSHGLTPHPNPPAVAAPAPAAPPAAVAHASPFHDPAWVSPAGKKVATTAEADFLDNHVKGGAPIALAAAAAGIPLGTAKGLVKKHGGTAALVAQHAGGTAAPPTPTTPPAAPATSFPPATTPPKAPKIGTFGSKSNLSPAPGTFPPSLAALGPGTAAGGSTGAAFHKHGGMDFVVKAGKTPGHAENEYHANNVYRAAGLGAPPGTMVEGKLVTAKIAGKSLNQLSGAELQAAHTELRKGFALDVVLGNRDVIGQNADNVIVGHDGKVHRIDNGSAFDYRAQGGKKPFTSDVGDELHGFRDPNKNPSASKVFGGMTDTEIHQQALALQKQKATILAAVPAAHKAIVASRIDDLVTRTAPVTVGPASFLPTGKTGPQVSVNRAPAGTTFKEYNGLPEATITSTSHPFIGPWAAKEHALPPKERMATTSYTGSGSGHINGPLRKDQHAALSADHKAMVANLDQALHRHTIGEPTVLHRGVTLSQKTIDNFLQPNQVFVDRAFASTTIDKTRPFPGNVIFHMKAPPETRGLYVGHISSHKTEAEWLLPRGTGILVQKVEVIGSKTHIHGAVVGHGMDF